MPGRLVFSTTADGASTPTERMRIDSQGRVGIGTTSPSRTLHIEASQATNESLAYIKQTATGRPAYIGFTSLTKNFTAGVNDELGFIIGLGNGIISNSNDIALSIDTSKRVGIGKDSAATALDVNGDVTITDKIIHGGNTNTAIRFPAADTFSVETSGSERARIDSSGRLLVGTSSTANRGDAKHIVQGDASFGDGVGKVHTIYKETTNLADAATFDVDLISNTGACSGFGTVFYREGTNQQVQTFSFAGRQTGAVVQLQDANIRSSGISGVTVTFAAVSSAGKIRITNGSGTTLDAVQVTLFLHSTLS
jgi:hypothetical protein